MSISVGSDYQSILSNLKQESAENAAKARTAKLESTLKSDLSTATDEELMDVCKSFEAYMLEQVMKQAKSAMTDSEEEENQYMSLFGDNLYQEVANQITEKGEIGLAQQLYEAMKRDYGKGN